MATYHARMSTEPGRLSIVIPEGSGAMTRTCQDCEVAYGETLCIEQYDGLLTHGLCQTCAARAHERLARLRVAA